MEANIQQHSHLLAASRTMNQISGCICTCHCDADFSPVEIRGKQLLWNISDILASLWDPKFSKQTGREIEKSTSTLWRSCANVNYYLLSV